MLEQLKKLTEHALGITILFYILGFLVTTVYLCSLGVVWFDAIKPRYIVIGLLFAGFVLSFVIPLRTLRNHLVQGEVARNFVLTLGVTMTTAVVVFSAVFFVENSLRIGLRTDVLAPQPATVEKAFANAPSHFRTQFTGVYAYVMLTCIALITVVKLATRKFKPSKETFKEIGTAIIPLFVAGISWTVLSEVLEVYKSLGPKEHGSQKGWNLLIIVSLMSYLIGALFLFWSAVHKPSQAQPTNAPKEPEKPTPVLDWSTTLIRWVWISSFACPILPIYATVVYPRIVQGIGGGAPVMVQLAGTDGKEQPWTANDTTYVVERNDRDTLLLIKSGDTGRIRIVDVKTDKLGTIEYPDPGTSEAAQ